MKSPCRHMTKMVEVNKEKAENGPGWKDGGEGKIQTRARQIEYDYQKEGGRLIL